MVVSPKQARVEVAVDDVSVALMNASVPVPDIVAPVALAAEPLVPSDTADEVVEVKVPSLASPSDAALPPPPNPDSPPRPRSVFVLEPRPHAQEMYFNGMSICKCGETDCPYEESGFSPKKQDSPRIVVPVWRPDLSAYGSSSTDTGTQREANKVADLSSYENGERELCVITVGARPDLNSSQLPRVSGPVLGRSQPSCISGPVPGRTQAQSVSSTSMPTTSRQCESKAPSRQQTVADRSLGKSQTKELARSFQIKAPGSSRQQ